MHYDLHTWFLIVYDTLDAIVMDYWDQLSQLLGA